MPLLKARLLSVEDEFLSALAEGEDAVLAFNERWEQLVEEVESTIGSACADTETLSLVHAVATRVATLADTSVALFSSYETINSQLMDELESFMSELTFSERYPSVSSSPDPPSFTSRKRSRNDIEHLPAMITSSKRRRHSPPSDVSLTAAFHECSSNVYPPPTALPLSPPSPPSHMPSQPVLNFEEQRLSKKRRRVSEGDDYSPAKRLYTGPRVHAVSDSFLALSYPRHNTPSTNIVTARSSPVEAVVSASPPVGDENSTGIVASLNQDPLAQAQLPSRDTCGVMLEVSPLLQSDGDSDLCLPGLQDLDEFLNALLDPSSFPLCAPSLPKTTLTNGSAAEHEKPLTPPCFFSCDSSRSPSLCSSSSQSSSPPSPRSMPSYPASPTCDHQHDSSSYPQYPSDSLVSPLILEAGLDSGSSFFDEQYLSSLSSADHTTGRPVEKYKATPFDFDWNGWFDGSAPLVELAIPPSPSEGHLDLSLLSHSDASVHPFFPTNSSIGLSMVLPSEYFQSGQ